jgi:tRNA dimethylallyltransferase
MPNKNIVKKIIIVVGPTASGKSELAVKIAKKINGEIISADSRQIYKGMDIGSGKVEGKWVSRGAKKVYVYKDVPHYLIDEASPKVQYSVARFQKKAQAVIADIIKRGKVPIVCGGTAQWVDAIAYEQILPTVPPDHKLRRQLGKLTAEQMFNMLKKLDPKRAKGIDAKNPRRLIRALEIVMSTGKPVPEIKLQPKYFALWLGINPDQEVLEKKIGKRLKDRLKQGMVKEIAKLHKQGLSWARLESFGLEYKFCALFLQKKITENELEEQLFTAIRQYTKRQKTWWKRNAEIHWSEKPEELIGIAKNSI